jgi:hypothetical protein
MEAYIAKGQEQHCTFYPTDDPTMLGDVHISAWRPLKD